MSGETILIFYSKFSNTCAQVYKQLQYINDNMPSVVMYDIDDPKTREMVEHFKVIKTVPSMILLNHASSRLDIYEGENARELIDKAVQIINNQKTQSQQKDIQRNTTPVGDIDMTPNTLDPQASANMRTQPPTIHEQSHDDMARSTMLPPVAPDRTSAIKKSKVFDDNFVGAGTVQKSELDLTDILGNQDAGMVVSKAKMEKSNALKQSTESMMSERDAMFEEENRGRRPPPQE